MISDNAHKAFQNALKQALDMYHPQWELGYKGKGRGTRRLKFETIACETIRDWMTNEKGQCPQQQVFEVFLEEAQFPEEMSDALLTVYRTFKRERRRNNRQKTITQEPVLTLLSQKGEEDSTFAANDTIQHNRFILRKEYMSNIHENERPSGLVASDGLTEEQLRNMREVYSRIGAEVSKAFEAELEKIATDPTYQEMSSEVLADVAQKGVEHIADLPGIHKFVDAVRKTSKIVIKHQFSATSLLGQRNRI